MVVSALAGALGFLSRFPIGHDERAWEAFRRQPATFPLAGYVLGAVLAVPLVVIEPSLTGTGAFVVWIYLVTGVTHADALADFGDALATHGDANRRREAMTDTAIGVGGALALGLGLLALTLAGLALATRAATGSEVAVLAVVVATEVGAKTAMATVVCLGSATHDGLGAALTEPTQRRSLPFVALAAAPALGLGAVTPVAAVAALGAVLTAGIVLALARAVLGGVSGDVIGATNEIARVVGLHAGVVAWTHL